MQFFCIDHAIIGLASMTMKVRSILILSNIFARSNLKVSQCMWVYGAPPLVCEGEEAKRLVLSKFLCMLSLYVVCIFSSVVRVCKARRFVLSLGLELC